MSNVLRVLYDHLSLANDQSMSWQGHPFTGVAYELADSGQLISEAAFEDGCQRGLAREWFESGQVRSEAEYVHGCRHGYSRTWHENGQVASEAAYEYSIKVAEKTWNEDSVLMTEWSLSEDDPQRALIELLAKHKMSTD
jgi:antitoxin component YwqK of YwqJK toxin-antitoxin module